MPLRDIRSGIFCFAASEYCYKRFRKRPAYVGLIERYFIKEHEEENDA